MKTKTIDSLILCQSFDFPWNIRPFFKPLRLTVSVAGYSLMLSTPDPRISFGRPMVVGTGIPTLAIAAGGFKV